MNKLFCTWEKRRLSILGKILIIKSLILPLFTFLASVCLVPDVYQKEIEKKCFKSIWNGKSDKVKRNIIIDSYEMLWHFTTISYFFLPINYSDPRNKRIETPWVSIYNNVLQIAES
jgi:hypothetical protein